MKITNESEYSKALHRRAFLLLLGDEKTKESKDELKKLELAIVKWEQGISAEIENRGKAIRDRVKNGPRRSSEKPL